MLGRFCWFLFIIVWLRECGCERIWFVGCGSVGCLGSCVGIICCDGWMKFGEVVWLFNVDWFGSWESVCRCIWFLGIEWVFLLVFFERICEEVCRWRFCEVIIWVCNWLGSILLLGVEFFEGVCEFLDRCKVLGGCIWLLNVCCFVCVNLKFWEFIWFCSCDCILWFGNCGIFEILEFLWIWVIVVLCWSWLSRWFCIWEIFCLFVSIVCLLELGFVICFCCCCK